MQKLDVGLDDRLKRKPLRKGSEEDLHIVLDTRANLWECPLYFGVFDFIDEADQPEYAFCMFLPGNRDDVWEAVRDIIGREQVNWLIVLDVAGIINQMCAKLNKINRSKKKAVDRREEDEQMDGVIGREARNDTTYKEVNGRKESIGKEAIDRSWGRRKRN